MAILLQTKSKNLIVIQTNTQQHFFKFHFVSQITAQAQTFQTFETKKNCKGHFKIVTSDFQKQSRNKKETKR